MRLIETFKDAKAGKAVVAVLLQKGIGSHLEILKNQDWGSPNYGLDDYQLWIEDEDQIDEALKWLHLYQENPNDPIFSTVKTPFSEPINDLPLSSASPPKPEKNSKVNGWDQRPMGWVTRGLLIVCVLLFIISKYLVPTVEVPERYAGLSLFTSPIEKNLLYDYPKFYELIDRFVRLYGYKGLEDPSDLPEGGQALIKQINSTPYWPGFYHLFLKDGFKKTVKNFTQYPMFEKIQEGQVWRLFSPCLLHGDPLHLLFNMLWLIVLGKQIEMRLSPGRFILFILITGILSNTAQYLMGGPNFIGFSGVLCAMLAFIWVRQNRAAWEGYQVDRLTLVFMLIFILGMAGIQLLSFFTEKTFDMAFSPNIANMAHLTGGITGYFLGKLEYFSWRHA